MIKRYLKNTRGYTLVELLFVITIFSIGIGPVYKMIITGAKVQKVAEETYEATLKAQSLLQNVKQQIQKDVEAEYALSRGLPSAGIKEWLQPGVSPIVHDLPVFLEIKSQEGLAKWNEKYKMDTFLYELYIWPMTSSGPVENPLIFTTYPLEKPLDFAKVNLQKSTEKYFSHQESLLWTDLGQGQSDIGTQLVGVGEVSRQGADTITIRGSGLEGENIRINNIEGYTKLEKRVRLTYEKYIEQLDTAQNKTLQKQRVTTHQLVIEEKVPLQNKDAIQLSIDLTTFHHKRNPQIIRIENRTKATVAVPIYNENALENILVYPTQKEPEGNIILEKRNKQEPNKNFIIGIVVRDAHNSLFGDKDKILTKLSDVYSYDYHKQGESDE